MPKGKPQRHGRCVFCKGTGLSKEHIISDWIGQILPRSPSSTQSTVHISMDHAARIAFLQPSVRQEPGSFGSRKIRNVCASCNSGWISGIVARAKTVAKPMILGQAVRLSQSLQRDMAAWVAVTCIMAEYTDIRTAAIPETDRRHVMVNEEPPDNWIVSIGRYSGKEFAANGLRYRHHAAGFLEPLLPGPINLGNGIFKRYQITTLVIGSLVIQCFSSTSLRLTGSFRSHWIPNSLLRIWPLGGGESNWPATPTIGDDEMTTIADAFSLAVARSSKPLEYRGT